MRVSLLFGQQIDDIDAFESTARFCERAGLRLWVGQSLMIESHIALAALAGRGVRLDVGLSVAVAPLRTPYAAITQARSIAALMRRPVAAAYGMGTAAMAAALLGQPLARPAQYTAEYIAEVRRLRDSPTVASAERDSSLALYPLAAPPVEVGCGVLRPGMARRAGAVADFAVTWLTPRPYLFSMLFPALAEGAASAGAVRPRVVSVVPVAVADARRDPARLAVVACGTHVGLPHYADMLRAAGLGLTGDRAADLRTALRAGLFTYGTADDVAAEVRRYAEGGVDEVVLNLGAVALVHGHDEALRDARQIVEALTGTVQRQEGSSCHREPCIG